MKKKANIGLISLVVMLVIAKCFGPRLYIGLMFFGSEIIGSEVYSDSGERLSKILPHFGNKYMVYELYNAKEDIYFNARFNQPWYSPFYIPESKDNYSAALEQKNKRISYEHMINVSCSDMEEIISEYTDQVFIIQDPFDTQPGYYYTYFNCHFFIGYLNETDLVELINELDSYIDNKLRYPNRFYISYTLNICMDSEFLDEIKKIDLSGDITDDTGQVSFEKLIDNAGYEYESISAYKRGFSSYIYIDPDNDSYTKNKKVNNFEHLFFQYISNPDMVSDNRQQFYLLGANPHSDQ